MTYSVYIKKMYGQDCKVLVRSIFAEFNITPVEIKLGEVILDHGLIEIQERSIDTRLRQAGYSIISDKRAKIVVKVKGFLLNLVEYDHAASKQKLSGYLSHKMPYEYNYLSTLFSEVENNTIEHFFISLKIEKVKELIRREAISFGEIAYRLGYSSQSHLSNQFKKVTGISPTEYKKGLK